MTRYFVLDPKHRANMIRLAQWFHLNRRHFAEGEGWTLNMSMYSDYQDPPHSHLCGTTACAIGWATHAVEPLKLELDGDPEDLVLWEPFARRVFGTHNMDHCGSFLFSHEWEPDSDVPLSADSKINHLIDRLIYVAVNGHAPVKWEGVDSDHVCQERSQDHATQWVGHGARRFRILYTRPSMYIEQLSIEDLPDEIQRLAVPDVG